MDQSNLDEMIKKIKMLVMLNKDQVPKGSLLWNKKPIKDVDDLMNFLVELFNKEEEEIRKEHEKKFVTDDYEDGVRSFATWLMERLLPFHNQLKDRESYKALCRKRHIGYGYYNLINNEHFKGEKISDGSSQKLLYLSLAEFYDNFYGSFYDNEQAIELLCKFYPNDPDMDDHVQKIVSALYVHILNAGTPNDIGYAFRGIKQIQMYIDYLPDSIIYALLNRYSLYNLIYQKI